MRKSLEAVLLMGVASVLSLGLGAVRTKIVAVELGAAGIGSLGVLMAAATTLATAFGFGLGVSGVSAIASALEHDRARSAREALRRGTWCLGPAAGVLTTGVWALWGDAFGGAGHSELAPSLGIAVTAMILAARNAAVLSGVGKVRHLAAVQVVAALLATLALPLALPLSDAATLAVALAGPPLALAVAAAVAVRRYAPAPTGPTTSWRPELGAMVRLGVAVSASTILVSASQLFAASWVTRTLGIHSTGLFQASWSVAHLYLTFLLAALTAEYLPRLSKQRHDRAALNSSADHQVRLLVALTGPVIAWLIVLSPWVLRLLYAAEFETGADLLRLQLAGDVFKILGWTLAFILLARGSRGRYFLGELSWNVTFVGLVALLTRHGLEYVGLSYAVAFVVYLGVTAGQTRFRPGAGTVRIVAVAVAGVGGVYLLLHATVPGGVVMSVLLASALSAWALVELRRLHRNVTAPVPDLGVTPR